MHCAVFTPLASHRTALRRQVLTRRPPFHEIEDDKHVWRFIIKGKLPSKPVNCPGPVYDKLMLRCWDQDPAERLTFSEAREVRPPCIRCSISPHSIRTRRHALLNLGGVCSNCLIFIPLSSFLFVLVGPRVC